MAPLALTTAATAGVAIRPAAPARPPPAASLSTHRPGGVTSRVRPSPLASPRSPVPRPGLRGSAPQRSARVQLAPDSRSQVITIGEALFDCLAADDQMGKLRADVESWTPFPGGAPANVATALSQLGVKCTFFTALGKDEFGDQLVALLEERGVDLSGVQRVEQPTRDVYVERSINGDRNFAGFGAPADSYADCFIDSAKLPMELIDDAMVVVSGTLGLAYPVTRKTMEEVVARAKAAGTAVLIDVNWRPVFFDDHAAAKAMIEEYVAKADLVKITDEEADWLFGMPREKALENPELVLAKLPNAAGVLVTAGEFGATYCFRTADGKHVSSFLPALDIKVEDTTGAGDAFTAGFLKAFVSAGGVAELQAKPELLEAALKYACSTGALTCMGKGAIAPQPKPDQVDAMVASIP
mmetsp:Transcript_4593/g.11797  ORF Transcript_4593/g.11797 Transcript_4593/m.11797 type:complete len:412 (-) Transcript_4593:102-1337(-)